MFLSKIDMLGMTIQPTFNSKTKISSVLGGVFSIILIGLFSVAFVFFGRDIVEKQNPISNISEIRTTESIINLKEIPLITAAVSDFGEILHLNKEFNEAVYIGAALNKIEDNIEDNSITFTPFNAPLVPCTVELLGQSYFDYVSSTNFQAQYFLCIDYDNFINSKGEKLENPILKDSYGVPNSSHLIIYLRLCDKSKNARCREALEALGSFQFISGFPKDILDISNNETPVFRDIKYLQTTTFVGLSFSQEVSCNINELITDEGWIFKQENTRIFYSSDSPTYNTTLFSEEDRIMGRIMFSMSMVKKITKRRYMKVQELFANIGGFLKVSMLIFSSLLKNYSKWILFNQIRVSKNKNVIEKNASGIVPNDNFVSGINLEQVKNLEKVPFSSFLKALLSSEYRTKSRINYEETMKCLDLDYISKQLERLEDKTENSST